MEEKRKRGRPKRNKPMWYRASVSGGKDSMAMFLRIIEEGKPLDEVLFIDTTLEYECVYKNQELIKKMCEERGIKYTRLKPEHSVDWYCLFGRRKENNQFKIHWESFTWHWGVPIKPHRRWCLHQIKRHTTDSQEGLSELKYTHRLHNYIGIAKGENRPLIDLRSRNEEASYPLIEWGMTEPDCLQYCYDHGIDFDGSYEWLEALSCWCCPSVPKKAVYDCWEHRYDKFRTLYAREHIIARVVKNEWCRRQPQYQIYSLKNVRDYIPIEQIDLICDYLKYTYGGFRYLPNVQRQTVKALKDEAKRRSDEVIDRMEALPLNLEQLIDLPENWNNYPTTKEGWLERVREQYARDKALLNNPESPYYGTLHGDVPEYYVKQSGETFLYTADEFSDWLHSVEHRLDRDADRAFYNELNDRYGIRRTENKKYKRNGISL